MAQHRGVALYLGVCRRVSRVMSSVTGPRLRPPGRLGVHLQERLVQLLRIVEDGWPDLIGRPLDGAAVRVHLVGRVAAKGFETVPRGVEEIDRGSPGDPVPTRAVVDPRLM